MAASAPPNSDRCAAKQLAFCLCSSNTKLLVPSTKSVTKLADWMRETTGDCRGLFKFVFVLTGAVD